MPDTLSRISRPDFSSQKYSLGYRTVNVNDPGVSDHTHMRTYNEVRSPPVLLEQGDLVGEECVQRLEEPRHEEHIVEVDDELWRRAEVARQEEEDGRRRAFLYA